MTAIIIRLAVDRYRRRKEVAKQRGASVNRLIDEMTTLLLAGMDKETRVLMRAE